MADLYFMASGMNIQSGAMHIQGVARCSPDSDEIAWDAEVGWDDTPAQVNAACQAAAIAAADVAGYTVGGLDNKTLIAGAIGLV